MTLTRREALRLAGATAGLAAGGGLLAACGSSGGSEGPVRGGGSAPARRGGTVRLAFTGGGAGETLDPLIAYSPADLARGLVVFDRLFTLVGGRVAPALAVSARPAADARSFVLTLRQGVTWHDGTPLTSADVVHTLAMLASPSRPHPSELTGFLDVAKAEATGDLTVKVPTKRPVGDPAGLLAGASLAVIKKGTTSFRPGQAVVGTGPFKVAAFAPGREARLVRNDRYWGGPPNADTLVVLSVDDPQARANAVRGGQAEYASDIPFTLAKTGAGASGLEIRGAGENQRTGYGFVLNTTRKPFSDPRARMALRLAVDRQALVDRVFLGYGTVGNDLFGHGAQYFAAQTPVLGRDLARARTLLKEAGAEGAKLTIRSADYESGLNSSAELFAEQLRAIGLDAKAQIVAPTAYFDADGLAAADLLAFPLGPHPLSVIFNRSAAYPSLAFKDPDLDRALTTANATNDPKERERAWLDAQRVMTVRGNWIVWGRGDVLSLTRATVTGIEVRDSAKYPFLGKAGFSA
ncbi:ABC transporter substrate-binding protein [Spirillospora sp. CA-294931]|uniref:ABC transporter substrate-binding protein n=1 Tax=Spirillospora sp. CA-294931 TaxID=3240042 RepID=UPI003D8CFE7B